jgi:hypothetical protein
VHQVGFSLNEYIEMHGQQNIKFRSKNTLRDKMQISLLAGNFIYLFNRLNITRRVLHV